MSDPLERLRGASLGDAPSIEVIRSRAHRIQRRRYVAVASSAVVVVVLAGAGLFLRPGPSRVTQQQTSAQAFAPVQTAAAPVATAEKSAASSGAATLSNGSSYSQAAKPAPEANDLAAAPSGPLVAKVSVNKQTFTLSVCNQTASNVSRTFPTTQRYDFHVTRGSTDVWDWSYGKAAGDVVTSDTWKPRECKTWTTTWNGKTNSGAPASPGTYSVVGVMTSNPQLRTQPQNFCYVVC